MVSIDYYREDINKRLFLATASNQNLKTRIIIAEKGNLLRQKHFVSSWEEK